MYAHIILGKPKRYGELYPHATLRAVLAVLCLFMFIGLVLLGFDDSATTPEWLRHTKSRPAMPPDHGARSATQQHRGREGQGPHKEAKRGMVGLLTAVREGEGEGPPPQPLHDTPQPGSKDLSPEGEEEEVDTLSQNLVKELEQEDDAEEEVVETPEELAHLDDALNLWKRWVTKRRKGDRKAVRVEKRQKRMHRPIPRFLAIFRHFEKQIHPKTNSLSPFGYTHSIQLLDFVRTQLPKFSPANVTGIVASRPRSNGKHVRPIQSATPLCIALELDCMMANTPSEAARRALLKGGDGTAVIVWSHGHIPILMKRLGFETPVWPNHDFTRYYVVDMEYQTIHLHHIKWPEL